MTYAAFCDPSGGVNDAMTLAVAHLRDGAICVLDAILEVRPPFDPEVAVAACTAVLRRFGVTRVVGDRYAGEWPKARFAEHGIAFEQSARSKSDLYICRHVDFMLGAIDQGNIDVFQVFRRRVVNDWRGIGAARRREQREENADRDAWACAALHTNPC